LQSLRNLNSRYPYVFNKPDEDSDTESTGGNRLFERIGWLSTLDQMAEGDKTKYPYFQKLSVTYALNLLTFMIIKKEEQDRIDEIQKALKK